MDLTKYQELKEKLIKDVQREVQESGGCTAQLSLIATKKDDTEKGAIIHIPIPNMIIDSKVGKAMLTEKIIPVIAEKTMEHFDISAVVWTSEGLMKQFNKDEVDVDNLTEEDYQKNPVKMECVMFNFEGEFEKQLMIYEVKRESSVDLDGNIVEGVNLVHFDTIENEDGTVEGTFAHLYKLFIGPAKTPDSNVEL